MSILLKTKEVFWVAIYLNQLFSINNMASALYLYISYIFFSNYSSQSVIEYETETT